MISNYKIIVKTTQYYTKIKDLCEDVLCQGSAVLSGVPSLPLPFFFFFFLSLRWGLTLAQAGLNLPAGVPPASASQAAEPGSACLSRGSVAAVHKPACRGLLLLDSVLQPQKIHVRLLNVLCCMSESGTWFLSVLQCELYPMAWSWSTGYAFVGILLYILLWKKIELLS